MPTPWRLAHRYCPNAARLLPLVWREMPRLLGGALALTALASVANAYGAAAVAARLTDALARRQAGDAGPEPVYAAVALSIAFGFVSAALNLGNGFVRHLLYTRLDTFCQLIVARAVTEHSVLALAQERHRKQVTVAQENTHRVTRVIVRWLDYAGSLTSLVAAGLFVATRVGPLAGLLLCLPVVPHLRVARRRAVATFRQERAIADTQRRGWYYRYWLMNADHLREFKLAGKVDDRLGRLAAVFRRVVGARFGVYRRFAVYEALLVASEQVLLALVTVWLVAGFIDGRFTVGEVTASVLALGALTAALTSVSRSTGDQLEDLIFLRKIFRLIDRSEKDPVVTQGDAGVRLDLSAGLPDIVFDDVWFRYPGATADALRGISLTIRGGEFLGVVGHNGSGKTTLIHVLAGLYAPTRGQVRVGGVPLDELNQAWWRDQIAVLFQRWAWFLGVTAEEAIALGHPAGRKGLPVEEAARLSGVLPVVDRWGGRRFGHTLGTEFKGGKEVSGGEGQMFAVARAFAADPYLLILDEPGSALDAANEERVTAAARGLPAGRTRIVITHRYGAIYEADRIVVLNAGRVEAVGTHAELLAREGTYRTHFHIQGKAFGQG